jgi:hypothetical protein
MITRLAAIRIMAMIRNDHTGVGPGHPEALNTATGVIQLLAPRRLGVVLPDGVGLNHVAVRVDDLRALMISHELPLFFRVCRDINRCQ